MAKYAARGTTLGRSTTDGGTYSDIAQIKSITGPELTRETYDVSDLQSDFMEFVSGMADGGEVTLDLVYDPADDTLQALKDDLVNALAGGLTYFQISWPTIDEDAVQFAALVTKFGPIVADKDGALAAAATLKVSGAPEWVTLAS